MRWSAGLLLALTGCHALLGIEDFETADGAVDAPADAAADAEIDAPSDSLTCYGTLKSICFTAVPTGTLNLSGAIITTSDPRCSSYPQVGGPDLCVMAAKDISVTGLAVVSGSRPLVLVADNMITLGAFLDASSRRGTVVGAGANGPGCNAQLGTAASGGGGNGGGGGGGGGFGAAGGRGGNGDNLIGNTPGGAGGALVAVTQIRGGCRGATGGDGQVGSAGIGGDGGGAIALIARQTISINFNGGVFASGAGGGGGGDGGADRGGGGAGGSGGLIVLEAPTINLNGFVTTNGGGGGGGTDSGTAEDGNDGTQQSFGQAARGGHAEAANHGADGGDGGFLAVSATNGLNAQQGGGGGGGGGVGVIWVHGTITGGTQVSPAVQQH